MRRTEDFGIKGATISHKTSIRVSSVLASVTALLAESALRPLTLKLQITQKLRFQQVLHEHAKREHLRASI